MVGEGLPDILVEDDKGRLVEASPGAVERLGLDQTEVTDVDGPHTYLVGGNPVEAEAVDDSSTSKDELDEEHYPKTIKIGPTIFVRVPRGQEIEDPKMVRFGPSGPVQYG